MKKLIALLLVAVFVSTAIVGCGGETKSTATKTTGAGGASGGGETKSK